MENQVQQQQTKSLELWKNASQKSLTLNLYAEKKKIMVSERTKTLSVKDAFNSGSHFAVLRKWNEAETIAVTTQMLTETLMLVPNNLTGEQIVYMAESIMIDCENWKPDDILLILRNGKQGKYGKMYGSFSYQTFNEWADAYAIERQGYVDNRHLETKEDATTSINNKQAIYEERKSRVMPDSPTAKIDVHEALESLGKSVKGG